MVRFVKAEEVDNILRWHFRNVDNLPNGRGGYALKFPTEYTHIVSTITGKTGFVLVVEENKQLAGYIGVRIDGDRGYLCGFYVDTQKRRKGYGRTLAEGAVEVAREKGVLSLSVEVGLKQPWLIKFYESVGFVSSSMTMYQNFEI